MLLRFAERTCAGRSSNDPPRRRRDGADLSRAAAAGCSPRSGSFPKALRFEFDLMSSQEFHILLLKGPDAMVFLLG